MRGKIVVILVILLLTINIASAGNTYELDFKKEGSYLIGLLDGDRVEFDLAGAKNTILVKEIKKDSATLATFIGIEKESYNENDVPNYATITNNKYLKLDFNRDNTGDLNVIFRGSNKTAASILFQLPAPSNKDLVVYSRSKFEKSNLLRNIIIVFLGAILIFGLVLYNSKRKTKINMNTKVAEEDKTTKQE
ncbi:hypothetical protein HYX16_05515 [Candidatus Woesearchaeota archaeon]|nr:hypothetical protein [Candidatus Woesearchaeota archaeon]